MNNSLIKDSEQFHKFINILPDLVNDEIYFISLSARNKYLNQEEREFYTLGKTEMFGRVIIRSKNDFEYAFKKLEAILNYKTTRNGKLIPEKSLVVYININPSSMFKSYYNFKSEMDKESIEVYSALLNNKTPNFSNILLLERKLLNCIQRSSSRKVFFDIDFDIKDSKYIDLVKNVIIDLGKNSINTYTIKTQGGFHLLINREQYNEYSKVIKLHEIIDLYHKEVSVYGKEIKFNKNNMIPFPGTLQAGKLVTFWKG